MSPDVSRNRIEAGFLYICAFFRKCDKKQEEKAPPQHQSNCTLLVFMLVSMLSEAEVCFLINQVGK